MEQTLTAQVVRRKLYARGTTLKGWCRKNGYAYRTAQNAVARHVGGPATREPWGPQTRAILIALGNEIGERLIPEEE